MLGGYLWKGSQYIKDREQRGALGKEVGGWWEVFDEDAVTRKGNVTSVTGGPGWHMTLSFSALILTIGTIAYRTLFSFALFSHWL